MDATVTDRRTDARFGPAYGALATLRPGCTVVLVDVSAGGALVEAPRPLRPGARVHLQVTTGARRYAIAAHVLRCMVWSLDPADGVRYRGALQFEQRIEWCWAGPAARGHILPGNTGPGRVETGNVVPEKQCAGLAAGARGRK